MNKTNQSADGLMESIVEKLTNIESMTTTKTTEDIIADALKDHAKRERILRETTITLKHTNEFTSENISEVIKSDYIVALDMPVVEFWRDKDFTYAKFLSKVCKDHFLAYVTETRLVANSQDKLAAAIQTANPDGTHFSRKDVRFEIPNCPELIDTAQLNKTITRVMAPGAVVKDIREGKVHGYGRKVKSIMLKTNAEGCRTILRGFLGAIPYNSLDSKIKTKLHPKISCKPWSCKDCYFIGPNHKCEGKICAQCAKKGHATKDCKAKIRYCANCKKRGHRAKDANCPIYMREVLNQIKRMDIPMEILEDESRRNQLAKSLYYK